MLHSALVDMHAKCGALAKLQHVLEDMYVNCGMLVETQHVLNDLPCTFWNGLVIGYSKHMHGEEAPSCFEQV